MRIDGFQNIPAVLQSLKSGRASGANSISESTGDSSSVNLSSFGSVLQSLQREVSQNTKTREVKVTEISDAIQNGTFKMDLNQLAAKLVDMQIIDFEG